MQFSLSEITCVVCCSEPSKPRIAIHTPKLTKGSSPLKLQFSGDTDMEDWMANLTSGKKLNKGMGLSLSQQTFQWFYLFLIHHKFWSFDQSQVGIQNMKKTNLTMDLLL
jgi:hypothetical protein